MTELSESGDRNIKRILIALDPCRQNRTALERASLEPALMLAGRMQAELTALFVEDENLLRLAGLPFAREVHRSTTLERKLDISQINRTLQRQTSSLRELIEHSAAQHHIQLSVRTVQGRFMTAAMAAAGDSDIAFLNVIDQNEDIFMMNSSYRTRYRNRYSQLKPVWSLYDASAEAERTLALAAELGLTETPGLILMLIASNSAEAAELRQHAEQRLKNHANIQYQTISPDQLPQLPRLMRRQGCSLLVLPREHQLLKKADNNQTIENFGCPLVLVR